MQNAVRDLIRDGLVQSAHDCSEGGLAVTLAESCFNPKRLFGAEISVARASGLREDKSAVADLRGEEDRKRDACATLFNESQSRIVISVASENLEKTISTFDASVTFHFSNWAKSAATNCKFASTNKPFAGELPRFTTSGGTRFVAQLNKTKAFRACESPKGAIESTPI